MNDTTMTFLQAHGVRMTPGELNAEMEVALRQRRARLALAPRQELTPEQAAVLEGGGLDLAPLRQGERLQADVTSADYAALIRSSLTTRDLARLLRRNPSRIRQRIHDGTIYAFRPAGEWLIPAFQVYGDALLPGLGKVVSRLRSGIHPLKVERWFLQPNPDLTDPEEAHPWAPREWLIAGGDPDVVADLAEHL